MNRLISVLVILSCIAAVSCAKKATVDDVVNKMVEAQGGAEALSAIQDQVSTWDTKTNVPMGEEMMPMTSEMIITYKRPDMIKFESKISEDSLVYASVYNGSTGWQYMMGQTREMSREEKEETKNMAKTWVDGFYNYGQKGFQLTLLPDTTTEGQTYQVIEATDEFGNTSWNYIDPQTHLLKRTEGESVNPETMEKEMYVMALENYADYNGIMMAQKVTSFDKDGNMMFEATLKDVKNNTGITDEAFSKPGTPAMAQME